MKMKVRPGSWKANITQLAAVVSATLMLWLVLDIVDNLGTVTDRSTDFCPHLFV